MYGRFTRYVYPHNRKTHLITRTFSVVEVHYREALKESAYIDYHQKNPTGSKIPLSLENVYKYFVDDPTLIQYKADQAQHKTNYHVWADRPISPTLKNYAAFDVASMRPVLQVFTKACKLYQWVSKPKNGFTP